METITPALGNAAHFAFTPDGEELWAASISTNLVWVIDVPTRRLEAAVPLAAGELEGASPEARIGLIGFNEVAISPDGSRAFVVGPAAGLIFAIDVSSREVVGQVRVGERVHGVSVTRDGGEVWTANNEGTVTILDARSLELLGEVDMRDRVDDLTFAHIGFSLDGRRAYVSWKREVSVIDVSGREVVGSIPVEDSPHENSLEDYYVRPPGPAAAMSPPARAGSGVAGGPRAAMLRGV